MQTLLDMVQEFTTWCGMEIKIKKMFRGLLVIDKDRKRRERMLAPDLRTSGKRHKPIDINDACQHPGYWGMGKGDMSATRGAVCEKTRLARDLIKSNPLTPDLFAELFAQKDICAFQFLAASSNGRRVSLRVCKKSWYRNSTKKSIFKQVLIQFLIPYFVDVSSQFCIGG